MSVADKIPTLDDAALANLRSNAARLETQGDKARQQEAVSLLPLIDAEIATRKANKPPKATVATKRKPAAKKASATAALAQKRPDDGPANA